MTAVAQTMQLSEVRPWPGLAAFEESQAAQFFGRDDEVRDILRLLRRSSAVVLSGKSGFGKTSLLQAGLFPRLSELHLFPVYVRLAHHTPLTPESFLRQVLSSLETAMRDRDVLGHLPASPASLWQVLFHKDSSFLHEGYLDVQPLFILDQFEEWFTLGSKHAVSDGQHERLLEELACLIEGRPPSAIVSLLEEKPHMMEEFMQNRPGFKTLICLREDYIAELDELSPMMPALRDNRHLLRPLRCRGALEAVCKPVPGLVPHKIGEMIVNKLAGANEAGNSRNALIDPALLCLFCNELNERRIEAEATTISEHLVNSQSDDILRTFYLDNVTEAPAEARRFLEEELVTVEGYRDSRPYSAASASNALGEEMLQRLVNRRILRVYDGAHGRRTELTHDILAKIIVEIRPARQAQEQAQAAAKTLRRKRLFTSLVTLGLGVLAALVFAVQFWHIKQEAKINKAEARSNRAAAQAIEAQRRASDAQKDSQLEHKLRSEADEQKKQSALERNRAEIAREEATVERDKARQLAEQEAASRAKADIASKAAQAATNLADSLKNQAINSRDAMLLHVTGIIDLFVASDDSGFSNSAESALPRRAVLTLFPIVVDIIGDSNKLGDSDRNVTRFSALKQAGLYRRVAQAYLAAGNKVEAKTAITQALHVMSSLTPGADDTMRMSEEARLTCADLEIGNREVRPAPERFSFCLEATKKLGAVRAGLLETPAAKKKEPDILLLGVEITNVLGRFERYAAVAAEGLNQPDQADELLEKADASFESALDQIEGMKGAAPDNTRIRARLEAETADALNGRGNIVAEHLSQGKESEEMFVQQKNYYLQAQQTLSQLEHTFGHDPQFVIRFGNICNNLAGAYRNLADLPKPRNRPAHLQRALDLYVQRRSLQHDLYLSDTDNVDFQVLYAKALLNLAAFLCEDLKAVMNSMKYQGETPSQLQSLAQPLIGSDPEANRIYTEVLTKLGEHRP